jgi:predicted signal transduction protein with EAL and GGDEF domain
MQFSDPRLTVLVLGLLQAAIGLGLAALFLHYNRHYRRPHLAYWSASFIALALYQVFAAASLFLVGRVSPQSGLRTLSTLISLSAGYVHVALLVLGTLALRARQDTPRWLHNGVLMAAVVLALTGTFAFVWDPDAVQARVFARVSLRYLVAAAAYFGVAMALFSGSRWREPGVGQRVVAIAFFVVGALSLVNVATTAAPLDVAVVLARYTPWFGLLDLLAIIAIGVGLSVWLHEDERRRAETAAREVAKLTYFDAATGLPNRRRLLEVLGRRIATAGSQLVAVVVLRADRLRALRHAFGEAGIVRTLQHQARQIEALIEPGREPALARLDEDRLAFVLPPVPARQQGIVLARSLQGRLNGEIAGLGPSAFVTNSAGIAFFPDDAADADALLSAAVSAEARAEAAGGNRVEDFRHELGEFERTQLAMHAELRRALLQHELELHYQPVIDLASARIGYAEALLRWRHPDRGLLLPAAFLPIAENAGLMTDIDRYVIHHACRAIARRLAGGGWVPIAVNVSAESFLLAEFPDWVADALAVSRAPAAMLEIEITEVTAVRDFHRAAASLGRLRQVGVGITLDDFGVGYSSLAQLKHLAADKLKIDQCFTAGVPTATKDAAIARALAGLGRDLGMRVVAEGVETVSQLEFYRELGVRYAQGFLFDRPLPENELVRRKDEPFTRAG